MKLKDIMSLDLEVVEPESILQEEAKKMKEINAGPIPVVEKSKPIGVLTDRDIATRAVSEGKDLRRTKVIEIMAKEVVSCFEDQDIREAEKSWGEKQIRRLLFLDHRQNLVGIVSLGDIAIHTKNKELGGATFEEVSQH